MTTTPLLNVKGLTKAYGALTVTDQVDLQVLAGECHAIIGPNGAGKTTLVHQLAGSLTSDAGSIFFDDIDVTRLTMAERVHRGIARSFQITTLLPGFSVLENVALAVQARSGSSFRFFSSAARERDLNDAAMAALSRVRLADRVARRAGDLSHGEKRQLEIAVALATEAKLLLLDEPLAGTGREESAALVQLLSELKATHTLLLVEHDMEAVFGLADRISVLTEGRLIATGTPAEIRENAVVRAAYLGDEGTA